MMNCDHKPSPERLLGLWSWKQEGGAKKGQLRKGNPLYNQMNGLALALAIQRNVDLVQSFSKKESIHGYAFNYQLDIMFVSGSISPDRHGHQLCNARSSYLTRAL
jgi:hypothetical protein